MRSITSKLLTPQWRIQPRSFSSTKASIVCQSGTEPRQCSRYMSRRSVLSRRRLAAQASMAPRWVACDGSTLLIRKTSSRRPLIASPTSCSVSPSAYISAVSIRVMPSSRPSRSAPISAFRCSRTSAMCQVPCPSTGIFAPAGRAMRRITGPYILPPCSLVSGLEVVVRWDDVCHRRPRRRRCTRRHRRRWRPGGLRRAPVRRGHRRLASRARRPPRPGSPPRRAAGGGVSWPTSALPDLDLSWLAGGRLAQAHGQYAVVQRRFHLLRVDVPGKGHHVLELPDPPHLAAQYPPALLLLDLTSDADLVVLSSRLTSSLWTPGKSSSRTYASSVSSRSAAGTQNGAC